MIKSDLIIFGTFKSGCLEGPTIGSSSINTSTIDSLISSSIITSGERPVLRSLKVERVLSIGSVLMFTSPALPHRIH